MSTTVDAKQVLEMLRRHYERQNGVWAPEIASPCGKRRADLIWVERRPHRELAPEVPGAIIGHEIKVSRADLRSELADMTKWEAWRPYVDRWWLVIPDMGLASGLEIPAQWGIMTQPSGRRTRSLTVERPAPLLPHQNQAVALMRIVKWQDNRVRQAREQAWKDRSRIARLEQHVETLRENHRIELERIERTRTMFAHLKPADADPWATSKSA